MAQERKKRKRKPVRQDWKPHWLLSLLYRVWLAVFAVAKIALGAAATVLIICGVCVIVFVGILGDYLQEDILPDASLDLDSYAQELNSFMYYTDSSGNIQQLRMIYSDVNRREADYEDIPENLIHAAIAIEDKRFYEHQGVDWITTIKACAGIFFGDGDKGGSTITQQLIKNATGDNSVTVQRKVREICTATQLEKRYDKEVIMERYLNTIYFGKNSYGVRAAASIYYGKELEMLTLAECASLISITNNPSLYNPYREALDKGGLNGAERNRVRQIDTLDEMLSQNWITQEEYDEAIAQEMVFKSGIAFEDKFFNCGSDECDYRGTVSTYHYDGGVYTCPQCGSVTPISEGSTETVYSWFEETVLEDVAYDLAAKEGVTLSSSAFESDDEYQAMRTYYMDKIERGGYHIYTTLDMDVQKQADEIYTDLDQIPKTRSNQQLQSAIVIIDNMTGDIVAIVGGVGEKTDFDAWNCATDAKLQTGSSIKPLTIYAPAFELGIITPASVVTDLPFKYEGSTGWPKNDNRLYNWHRTIRTAVQQSVNAVAVNTLDMIGLGYGFSFAKDNFGLSTLTEQYVAADGEIKSDADYAPLAMGAQTVGVTVRDMASAFATFANNGVYREGRTYTKVYDNEGNLILDNAQDSREILSAKTVDYMNYCLQEAVTKGTGRVVDWTGMSIAGKTGSTSSNRDRWFCGYTGYYTAAVWCGYNQPEQIVLVGDTSNPAARLFKKVIQPLHDGLERLELYDRNKMNEVSICIDSGLLATEACRSDVRTESDFSRVENVKVYWEDRPKENCDRHVLVDFCTEGHGVCTDYCKLFAEAMENDKLIEEVALLKLTQEEIDAMKKAEKSDTKKNLTNYYLVDEYIYLVDKKGEDAAFKGVDGKQNKDVDAPYIVCPVHTQEAWEEYLESQAPTETEPTEGEDPGIIPIPGIDGIFG